MKGNTLMPLPWERAVNAEHKKRKAKEKRKAKKEAAARRQRSRDARRGRPW